MSSNVRKIVSVFLVFICLALGLLSCDFILQEDNNSSQIVDNVNINKDQANLLLKASKANIKTIRHLKQLKRSDANSILKGIIDTLEQQQRKTFNVYEKVAEENVVSIPHYFDNEKFIAPIADTVFDKAEIETIISNLNIQLELVEKLHSFSVGKATKFQMENAMEILESSNKISKKLLEKDLSK